MNGAASGYFGRIARRALAAPAIQPRLASRFEVPTQTVAAVTEIDAAVESAPAVPTVSRVSTEPNPVFLRAPSAAPLDGGPEPAAARASVVERQLQPTASLLVPLTENRHARVPDENHDRGMSWPLPLMERSGPATTRVAEVPSAESALPRSEPQPAAEPRSELRVVEIQREVLVPLTAPALPAVPEGPISAGRIEPLQSAALLPAVSTAREATEYDVPPGPAPIEIVIGRIEIRTSDVEPRAQTRATEGRRPPALTLDAYLHRREGRTP